MRTISFLRVAVVVVSTSGIINFASALPTPTTTSTPPVAATSTTVPAATTKGLKHQHHPDFVNELALTDAQKTQITQLKASGADKKTIHKEIQALLTPDQKDQLKTLKAQWKAAHPKPSTASIDSQWISTVSMS